MNIYIENSSWNNIGDFFYQNSIYKIFKDIYKDNNILSFDAPLKRSFKIKNKQFLKNVFDLRNFLDGDMYVLSGPILGDGFIDQYGEFIKKIYNENKKYLILSAFGKNIDANKKFLEKFPPHAISTRSLDTFKIYKEFTNNSYNGICNAFFMPIYMQAPTIIDKKYIIKSFYSMHEPDLSFDENGKNIDITSITLKYKNSIFWRLNRHLSYFIKNKDNTKNYEIIRTHHDLSYKFNHLNFSKKNSYLSYNILNYLSIYKNAKLIVSDRVHSVVLGLAYGVPSVLCGKWDRSALFDRLKLDKINNCYIPPKALYIKNELDAYKNWLKNLI